MKVLPVSEAKAKLSELVDLVDRRDESVAITRNGRPVAMLVSQDEYDAWRETVEILRDRPFMQDIRHGVRQLSRTKKRQTLDELFQD